MRLSLEEQILPDTLNKLQKRYYKQVHKRISRK